MPCSQPLQDVAHCLPLHQPRTWGPQAVGGRRERRVPAQRLFALIPGHLGLPPHAQSSPPPLRCLGPCAGAGLQGLGDRLQEVPSSQRK